MRFQSAIFNKVGSPLLWSTAFQYHLFNEFWPEIEFNTTYFPNGPNSGKTQVFMTPAPGLVIGRIPVYGATETRSRCRISIPN
jgi:hypothetical protein